MAKPWERYQQAAPTQAAPAAGAAPWERFQPAATPETAAPSPPRLGRAGRAEASRELPGTGESRLWGAIKDVGTGLYSSAAELSMGLQSMTPIPFSEGQTAALEESREAYKEAGPMAGVGRMGGEVAQYALPSKYIQTGLKGLTKTMEQLPKLAQLAKASPAAAGDVGAALAMGVTKMPQEGQTKMDTMATELAYLAGGTGLTKAMGKIGDLVTKGIKQTPSARLVADKGIELTPGKASESGLPRAFEYVSQVVPGLSKATGALQKEAVENMNRQVLKRAAPEGTAKYITNIGTRGMRQLKDEFTEAYTKAWSTAREPTAAAKALIRSRANAGRRYLGDNSSKQVDKALDELGGLRDNFSPKRIQSLDNTLRTQIRTASTGNNADPELVKVLTAMRKDLRQSLGKDTSSALSKVDAKYGEYSVVKEAVSTRKAMGEGDDLIAGMGGVFDADDLLGAAKNIGKTGRISIGTAPSQELAVALSQSLGRTDPSMLIDMMKGLAKNAPGPRGIMKNVGDVAMGRTGWQKNLQQRLEGGEPLADALRRFGITPGSIATGYAE